MAADANILREKWAANTKKVNAREQKELDALEVNRRCLHVEAVEHSSKTKESRRDATEKIREEIKSRKQKIEEAKEQRQKEKILKAQQMREEERLKVQEAREKDLQRIEEIAAQRKQAAAASKVQRAERVAEDLVDSIVHKAMLSQGSAGVEDGGPMSPRGNQNQKSHASLASSSSYSGPDAPPAMECPRERWKKVKPPPVHCPWILAKTHGLHRRPRRKRVEELRTVFQPEGPEADPADVWQDIYRAAVGRDANGDQAPEDEDPLSPGSVLPPNVPSTTDLFSSATSLHDGDPPSYERSESLRSLAWRQRKDHRYCQLPPVKTGDGEGGQNQMMMRLVPPKIPPSVMKR